MNKRLKTVLAVLMSLSLVLMLAACGGGGSSSTPAAGGSSAAAGGDSSAAAGGSDADPIKIALFCPMTGSMSAIGTYETRAMDIFMDYFNNKLGGVQSMGGAQLTYEVFDNQSDVTQVKTVMERLCTEYKPLAIMGSGSSSFTVPALPISEKYKIPFFTQNSAATIQESGYEYILALTPIADEQGIYQMGFLDWLATEKEYEIQKAAIMVVDNDYGISNANGCRTNLEALTDYELVYDETFPVTLSDASSLVTSCKASGADVLFLTAEVQQAPLIFDAMNALDYHPIIVGGGSGMANPSFAEALGDDCLGMVSIAATNRYTSNVYQNDDFVAMYDEYETKYNEGTAESFANDLAAVLCIYETLEANPTYDPIEFHAACKAGSWTTTWPSVANADGTPGKMEFKENGGAKNSVYPIVQWQKHDGVYEMRAVYPSDIVVGDGYIDYNIEGR